MNMRKGQTITANRRAYYSHRRADPLMVPILRVTPSHSRNASADDDVGIRERVHVAAHDASRAKVREAALGEGEQLVHILPGHSCPLEARVVSAQAFEKLQLHRLAALEPIQPFFFAPARVRRRVNRQI